MLSVYKKGVRGLKIIATRRKSFFALIALMISFSVLFLPTNNALAATTYKMTTTADANIRTSDSTKGKIIGLYKREQPLLIQQKPKIIGIKQLIKVKQVMFQANVLLHTRHLLLQLKALPL